MKKDPLYMDDHEFNAWVTKASKDELAANALYIMALGKSPRYAGQALRIASELRTRAKGQYSFRRGGHSVDDDDE